jgi:ribosomal protein L40E
MTGVFTLIAGFLLAGIGSAFFGQAYFCTINSAGASSCALSATDLANRLGYAIPLLVFGSFLITAGTIFTAAGHITEHLRPTKGYEEEPEEASEKAFMRVCVKCGRQVNPSASYCPKCGNQLSSA